MAEIRVLDKHTSELIAAGEVVERPASAAKELLENAVDAGATLITLRIWRGGVGELTVEDNGSGIEAEYIPTAFLRHATSKIRTGEDLDHIRTLGFRGEALASIASVARVELVTRTSSNEFAQRYRIEGGEERGLEAAARPVGTTISVRDLFYNTPARMKFLKKDASEGTFVADVLLHTALSHPEVSFRFEREGKLQYVTPGDGSLKSAAWAALGAQFARDLVPVENEACGVRVSGLITPPRAARASRSAQYFFINGRYIKNRTVMAALENAFKGTLMQGRFPGAILSVEMPAELVDVNVHPAKTEVRFAREGDVFDAVYAAVKLALQTPGTGEVRFALGEEATAVPQGGLAALPPTPRAAPAALSAEEFRRLYAPGPQSAGGLGPAAPASLVTPVSEPAVLCQAGTVQEAYTAPGQPAAFAPAREDDLTLTPGEAEAAGRQAPETAPVAPQQETLLPPEAPRLQYLGEAFKTYIVAQYGDELCFIDKHAAHERQNYEELVAAYGKVPGQLLMVPVQVRLAAAEKQAVLENLSLLADAGVEVEDRGGSLVAVYSAPANVEPGDVEGLVVELAARLAAGAHDAMSEKTDWVLHSISCRGAVKAGDNQRPEELLRLAERILSGQIPPFCPHGRPCVLKISEKELEKQFGRIV